MKTEVIMYRDFYGYPVRQSMQTGYICVTDLVDAYNEMAKDHGWPQKRIADYYERENTQLFLKATCRILNAKSKNEQVPAEALYSDLSFGNKELPVNGWQANQLKRVLRGKHTKGVWVHPNVFTDIALWLNPNFRALVIDWVTDNLLGLREIGGDAFKEVNRVLDMTFDIGMDRWEYIKVARWTATKVFGSPEINQWNAANATQLEQRKELLLRLKTACEFGSFKNVDDLLSKL